MAAGSLFTRPLAEGWYRDVPQPLRDTYEAAMNLCEALWHLSMAARARDAERFARGMTDLREPYERLADQLTEYGYMFAAVANGEEERIPIEFFTPTSVHDFVHAYAAALETHVRFDAAHHRFPRSQHLPIDEVTEADIKTFAEVARQGGPGSFLAEVGRTEDELIDALFGMQASLTQELSRAFERHRQATEWADSRSKEIQAVRESLLASVSKKAEATPRKRKRKVDRKVAKKRAETKERRQRERVIFDEWHGQEWEDYADYAQWKNANLPKGWKKLDRKEVRRAIAAVKRRLERKGQWPRDGSKK